MTGVDVYKRQLKDCIDNGADTFVLQPFCRILLVGKQIHGSGPVSYTHLDVYKRQKWCSATASTTRTPNITSAS